MKRVYYYYYDILSLCVLVVQLVPQSLGYRTGASTAACESMYPQHDFKAQSEVGIKNPYKLTFASSSVISGEWIEITLEKIDNKTLDFKGFMVQARDEMDNSLVGEFDIGSGKVMTCNPDTPLATISHSSNSSKEAVTFKWRTDAYKNGGDRTIRFDFTVVQEKKKFWVEKEETTNWLHLKENPKSPQSPPPSDGEGCFEGKGCFGIPSGCETKENAESECSALFKYSVNSEDSSFYDLEIRAIKDNTDTKYTAVGFSHDALMGDELVIGCLPEAIALYWNQGAPEKHSKFVVEVNDSHPLEHSIEYGTGGLRSCKITWNAQTTLAVPGVGNRTISMASTKFYILMARGNTIGNQLTYHYAEHYVSSAQIDLGVVPEKPTPSGGGVNIHGEPGRAVTLLGVALLAAALKTLGLN